MTRANSILLVAITLALLPAIAFSSPPDPSWIVGIYDGADADDIVTLITETPIASDATLFHVSPPLCSSETLHMSEPAAHGYGSASVQLIRGPPPNPSICLPRVPRLRSRPLAMHEYADRVGPLSQPQIVPVQAGTSRRIRGQATHLRRLPHHQEVRNEDRHYRRHRPDRL
jgi:hypothetical protein